jgi:large subunit ribosomal protein L30
MSGSLKITLVRSLIGHPPKHRKVVQGLGLRKVNRSVVLEDTRAVRGMVNVVSHLVKAEEINDETA